ncbi:RDD family protein [Thalassotalea profundi]|uniref:RDD family protein n=1 Tax=Thalassotalea profundi TaxID=2036687 RepID=A0ABQ3IV72_9GAMM|nr:RDD family protein [Thalassotalea profundi]GHE92983.1 RDD family protein [Thalassotalea profundi]
MPTFDYTQFPRAGLFRRLASWVYDFLLAMAVYMVAGAVGFAIFGIFYKLGLIDMSGHEHLIEVQQSSLFYSSLIYLWNLAWVAYFFVFFWVKSGQTLGMKAWRLRLQNTDGSLITRKTALMRLLPTLLGIGNFWLIIDRKNKQSLQDKVTNTEVVLLSLAANRGRL